MSQLILMRQRIKAIETIKKVTHAMRLISMSAHTRMRNKQQPLALYINQLSLLFGKLQDMYPAWQHPVMHPRGSYQRDLIILIGSQKGLCGNFNSALFSFAQEKIFRTPHHAQEIIAIGRKAVDFSKTLTRETLIIEYGEFNNSLLFPIARDIIDTIFNAQPHYTSIRIVSNKVRGFFFQKPTITVLVPFLKEENNLSTPALQEDYQWEMPPATILDLVAKQYIESRIAHLLFESLLAEQSARFLSMDNSTRSADNLLTETKLQYNKLRQAKITKELTELASNF